MIIQEIRYRLKMLCDLLADRRESQCADMIFLGQVLHDAYVHEDAEFDGHPIVAGNISVEFYPSAFGMVADVQDYVDHVGFVEK